MHGRLHWTRLRLISLICPAIVMLAGTSSAHAVGDDSVRGKSVAPAYVQHCSSALGAHSFYVYCNRGNQAYRAAVKCDGFLWDTYWRYSYFASPGEHRTAYCDGGDTAISGQLQIGAYVDPPTASEVY